MGLKVYHKSMGGREEVGEKTLKEKTQEQLASYPNCLDNVDMTSKFKKWETSYGQRP